MKKVFEKKKVLLVTLILMVGIFVGGCSNNIQSDKPIDIGHPKKGDFVIVGEMSVPRYYHEAILLDNGTVLVFGGQTLHKDYEGGSDTADIYDPNTKKFTAIGHMLRSGYKVPINLHNGKILLIGGSGGYPQKGTQFYNVSTKKFEIGPDLNYPRTDATATLLKNGKILITGGDDIYYIEYAKRNIPNELYNPITGKFEVGPKLNISRRYHSAILLKDGRVLIVGGVGKGGFLSEAEIYNPKTNEFNLVGKMNTPKMGPNLYLLKDGNVLASGGIKDQDKGMDSIFAREIELYNPKTNKFTIIATRTSEANEPAEVLLSDDTLLFSGSQTGVGLSLRWYASSEIFDPKTKKFTQGKNMNYTRSCHRETLLNDGNVLITGSYNEGRTAELYISK